MDINEAGPRRSEKTEISQKSALFIAAPIRNR
jgi:hypothetical protein